MLISVVVRWTSYRMTHMPRAPPDALTALSSSAAYEAIESSGPVVTMSGTSTASASLATAASALRRRCPAL